MELKTKVHAEDGKQEIIITREFDLPVELLFKAHTNSQIFAEWMSNPHTSAKVLKFEARKHGGFELAAVDAQDNIVFRSNGVFHNIIENELIIRTFEMENTPFPVQLEFLAFEKISDDKSKLIAKSIFKSTEDRDNLLKMPFAQGLNMAHDRLQEVVSKLI